MIEKRVKSPKEELKLIDDIVRALDQEIIKDVSTLQKLIIHFSSIRILTLILQIN